MSVSDEETITGDFCEFKQAWCIFELKINTNFEQVFIVT